MLPTVELSRECDITDQQHRPEEPGEFRKRSTRQASSAKVSERSQQHFGVIEEVGDQWLSNLVCPVNFMRSDRTEKKRRVTVGEKTVGLGTPGVSL